MGSAMSKKRTPNPHFSGTPVHRAWENGYHAALRDSMGIVEKAWPLRGRDIIASGGSDADR